MVDYIVNHSGAEQYGRANATEASQIYACYVTRSKMKSKIFCENAMWPTDIKSGSS